MNHKSGNIVGVIVLIILYSVGVIGILDPGIWGNLLALTPVQMLISFFILLTGYRKIGRRLVMAFILIYIFSWSIEAIGVATGYPFGNYTYGENLGFKVLGTPLIIGVNWLILALGAYSITSYLAKSQRFIIPGAAMLMVGLDLMIEQLAPELGFWYWEGNSIPLLNYLGWFVVATLIQVILSFAKPERDNWIAICLFICQVSFFLILLIGL